MSKSDAEISLKVNMPPPRSFEQMLHAFERISKGVQESMRDVGGSVQEVSEAARILKDRAAATGSESVQRVVAAGFSQTELDEAANMDKQAEKIRVNFGKLEDKVYALKQAYEAGIISEEEAAKKMEYFVRVAQKADEASSSLVYNLHTVEGDLRELAQMDDVLGVFDALRTKMDDVSGGAKILAANLTKQADALAEQREALDTSAPGYEQMAAALSKEENELRKASAAALDLGANAEKSFRKAKESFQGYAGGTEETAKLMADIQNRQGQMESLERKLQALQADAANREQQRLAKKEIEAEKEIELSKRKEEQEKKAALAQQQRQEADMYRTELLGKTKLELAAIIKRLNADMVAAGKAEDWATLDTLKQKMSIARSAMRNASMQANITRMTFMQQAATAGRLSTNVSTLADGFGALSEGAKNGQLNLTGMASSLMDLWFTMKAGMGPIGWMMMGLQGIQSMANSYIRNSNAIKKAEEDKSAVLKNVADAYQSIETAQKNSELNKTYNAEVQTLKEKYEDIRATLKTSLELIDKSTQAEIRRLSIAGEEEQLQRALNKMELSRLLEAGEISKAEYEESLLNMDYAAALSGAAKKTEAAKIKEQAAWRKEIDAEGYAKTAEAEAKAARKRQEAVGINEERYNELLRQRTALEQKLLDLKLNEKQYLAQESGFDLGKGLTEVFGAGVELLYDVNRPTETFEQVSSAYVDMNKALNEALRGITNELNDVAGRLGTGRFGDFNEVETGNAIKLLNQQAQQAEAFAKELKEEHKNAIKNRKEAQEEANLLAEEESRVKDAKKREFDAQKENMKARSAAEKKRKKREERMEKMLEDVDNLTLSELKTMRANAKKQAARFGKGTTPSKQYEAYIERISEEIRSRRKTISEVETAAEAEIQSRAGSNKALSKYSKLLNKVDFKGLSGVLDDGSISETELKLLQREWIDAVKARNATAMAFIQKIIQDAAESKRQDEAIVGAINTTRKKMEKQAQRMQKKLKTTLK